MADFKASRGGAKPAMLPGSVDWAISMGSGAKKSGMYEFNARSGELARRVELPQWLAEARKNYKAPKDFLDALARGALAYPKEEIGESRGHIFMRPGESLGWAGAAVGLDEEVALRARAAGSPVRMIRFVGYDPFYKLAFQWRIGAEAFAEKSKRVQTKPQFMAQWMVSLADLEVFVSR